MGVVSIDISVLGHALRTAAVSTIVSLALGLWLARLLVRRQFPGRRELGAVATAALALPAPVICDYAFLKPAFAWTWGLAAAAMLSATPMLIRAGRGAFSSLDPVYANAARTLGASEWRVFWRVEAPRIWRPAAAAVVVAFARILAELFVGILIAVRHGQ